MSVSATDKRAIAATLAVAVLVGIAVAMKLSDERSATAPPPAVAFANVTTPVEVIDPRPDSTPNASVAMSNRLYASSRAALVVPAADADALTLAEESGLRVPILTDEPGVEAEIKRLGATDILAIGNTRAIPKATPVAASKAALTSALRDLPAEVREATGPPHKVIVLTAEAGANPAATATAMAAGASVVTVEGGDPRTSSAAIFALTAKPTAPIILLGAGTPDDLAYQVAAIRSGVELPGGGYVALPGRVMVALYGHPGTAGLGVLGEQGVKATVKRATSMADQYQKLTKTPVVPTFEIIATVASAGAGKDNNYSNEVAIKTLQPLVDAAEKAGIYVILDLQPGRTDFLSQAKAYEPLLRRSHVGLALDPEWRLKKDQRHLRQIGSVGITEVNKVGEWLAQLTRENDLPQKVFVLHQFNTSMIKHRSKLDVSHPELATVIHVDGQGPQGAKQGTWRHIRDGAPKGVFWGWKNFYDEDSPTLTPAQTWKQVKPHPQLISYQ